MNRWMLSMMGVLTLVGIGLTASSAMADHDYRLSVSVAFGRGLNTVRPPGDPLAPVNHYLSTTRSTQTRTSSTWESIRQEGRRRGHR